ncbi:hypothetical protein KSS87_018250, partial [Heliosperma pusillum]
LKKPSYLLNKPPHSPHTRAPSAQVVGLPFTPKRRPPLHHQASASPSPSATTTSRLPQLSSPKSAVTVKSVVTYI